MAIIGISGRIGSGKDTVGKIIQYLITKSSPENEGLTSFESIMDDTTWYKDHNPCLHEGWQIKKFAYAVKQVCSILTGIPIEDFEKQEVKDRVLGEEWIRYGYADGFMRTMDGTPIMNNKQCSKERYEEQLRTNWPTAYKHEYTVRGLLQRVGTDAIRNVLHEDAWVNALMSQYDNHFKVLHNTDKTHFWGEGDLPNWIITDVRFPNEAAAIKKRGGIVIRVNRDLPCPKCGEYENIHSNVDHTSLTYKVDEYLCNECGTFFKDSTHPSETSLDDYQFDAYLDNNGTIENLITEVKSFISIHFKDVI